MNDITKFLEDNKFLLERVNQGIDVHPSTGELEQFEKLALQISPKGDFPWRGCQECVNHMVKFVFDNQDKLNGKEGKIQKMTFPKQNQ